MDMDSTLITIECIDEIADLQGIKPQVAAITASAMRGEIDFRGEPDAARRAARGTAGRRRCERVYDERLRLSPGAERMLAGFKAAGAKMLLVSGGFTFFTERLQERLGLDYTLSNTLEIVDGKLTGRVLGDIVDAAAKAARVARAARGAARRRRHRRRDRRRRERPADARARRTCRSPTTPSPPCARRRRTRSIMRARRGAQSVQLNASG